MIPSHFIILDKYFFYDVITDQNIKFKTNKNQFITQKGGYTKTIKFDDYTFKLSVEENKEFYHISVITPSADECITVYIFKGTQLVNLHNMSYYQECAKEGLKRPGGGKVLLKFIINYLKQNKDKYKIKRILLKDNSYLYLHGMGLL